eukprot:scaffold127488_cov44-Attheya_sp.AAC.5
MLAYLDLVLAQISPFWENEATAYKRRKFSVEFCRMVELVRGEMVYLFPDEKMGQRDYSNLDCVEFIEVLLLVFRNCGPLMVKSGLCCPQWHPCELKCSMH